MNWTRESDYHMVSDPRGYTIAKVFVMGQQFYEAWSARTMLATRLPSADAARATVERVAA